jgi:hypothetical protein
LSVSLFERETLKSQSKDDRFSNSAEYSDFLIASSQPAQHRNAPREIVFCGFAVHIKCESIAYFICEKIYGRICSENLQTPEIGGK